MEKMIRRRSDSLMCQYLWDAITTIRNHKQLPSFDRIRRYMNRTHSMEQDKVEKYLDECTLDNLIIVSRKVGQKGSKVGVEQEGFRLPTAPDEPDSHDWYCFECHKSGEIVLCSKCYRVYHPPCIDSQDYVFQPNVFVCSVCKKRLYQRTGNRCRISREELNGLLICVVSRLKEKLPPNLLERVSVVPAANTKSGGFSGERSAGAAGSSVKTDAAGGPNLSEPWRAALLLHHPMDLRTMEQKSHDGRYKTLFDFEIDALTIVHNITVFHGDSSPLTDSARQMLRDCQHDLTEIDQCKDCFRFSIDKNQRYWFCKPCNPPHELVYAKEKGFPYWPAKVLKVENDVYHVRFFGNHHQTADIEKSSIKSITTNIHSIQVKRTSAWMKAFEELKKHQEYLTNGYHEPSHPPPFPHAFQPPPPFQQPYPHPFHPHQQFHPPQYPQPPPPHMIHPHQPHWEPVPPPDPHQRILQTGLVPCHPHYQYPTPKKEPETQIAPVNEKSNSSGNVSYSPEKVVKQPEVKKLKPSEEKSDVEPANPGPKLPAEEPMVVTPAEEAPSSAAISSSTKTKNAKSSKKEVPVPEDVVSSSSQDHRTQSQGVQTSPRLIKMLVEEMNNDQGSKKSKKEKDVSLKELREKLTKEHEEEVNKSQMTLKQKENEFERITEELVEKHRKEISDTKRKQWCWTCEDVAMYHCCWNTAYCSVKCQQEHWHKEHKKNCRRKS